MTTLLRLAALLSVIRSGVLSLPLATSGSATHPTTESQATLLCLVVAHVAFAWTMLLTARNPRQNLSGVWGAIVLTALSVVTNLYLSLASLPAATALPSVVDLVLSFSLLVGMLESLPRLIDTSTERP